MHRRILLTSLAVAAQSAQIIKSPKHNYTEVRRIDKGGNGKVHIVTSEDGEELVIKCGPVTRTSRYEEEYKLMEKLGRKNWAVKPVEYFLNSQDAPCIVMEQLGQDLAAMRSADRATWSIPTVVSIGIGMIDALIDLHFEFNLVHKDLHSGNVAVRKNDKSKLVIFDYGDMVPATPGLSTKIDIRDAMLSMRYYVEGNRRFYLAKQNGYNKAEVCTGIPEELCTAIDTVYDRSRKVLTKDDYLGVRRILTDLLKDKYDVEYTGSIIWDLKKEVTKQATKKATLKKTATKKTTKKPTVVIPVAPKPKTVVPVEPKVAPVAPKAEPAPVVPMAEPAPVAPKEAEEIPVAPKSEEKPASVLPEETPVAPKSEKKPKSKKHTPKAPKKEEAPKAKAAPKEEAGPKNEATKEADIITDTTTTTTTTKSTSSTYMICFVSMLAIFAAI
jgi:hypothetical protein